MIQKYLIGVRAERDGGSKAEKLFKNVRSMHGDNPKE